MSRFQERALRKLEALTQEHHYLTSDDLQAVLDEQPGNPNEVGAIFRTAQDRRLVSFTGRIVPSSRPEAKGRQVKVWRSWPYRNQPDGVPLDEFCAERQKTKAAANQGGLF